MAEQEQVETTVENQADGAVVDQATTAVGDQVEETLDAQTELSKLLSPEQSEIVQEGKPQTEVEEAKDEVREEPKQEVGIIDDAMINEHPALRMYKGKPLKDLGKAYQNLVKAYTEDHKRLKQIEKERAEKSIPNPQDVPDPVEKPDEFKKYIKEFAEATKKQAIEEYLSKQSEPQTDWVAEARKIVPEGVDFENFRQDFMMFNAERFYNELGEVRPEVESFYNANPQILISEMKKHYELTSKANKSKTIIEKESKDTAYKTITNSLKKAKENKEDLQGAQFNAVSRSEQTTPEDEILAKIYKIAQG